MTHLGRARGLPRARVPAALGAIETGDWFAIVGRAWSVICGRSPFGAASAVGTALGRITTLALVIAVVCTSVAAPPETRQAAFAQPLYQGGGRDGTSYAGVWTSSLDRSQASALDDLAVAWARVVILWSEVEPSNDAFNWGALDESVSQASGNGRRIVALVRNNPNWAAASRCRITGDDERGRLADFMAALARRYQGRIAYWMLYNEPDNTSPAFDAQHDLGGCFGTLSGSTATQEGRDEYARAIEVVGRAVQDVDRNAQLILGGVASGNFTEHASAACPVTTACIFDRDFVKGVVSALKARGSLDRLGGVALHYFSSQAPRWASSGSPDLVGRVAAVRQDMVSAGLGQRELKPVMIEEGSYTGQVGASTADANDPFNRAQRDYVPKALSRAAAAGVMAYFWFWLQDTRSGLGGDNAYGLMTDSGAKKPSFQAMRYVTSLIARRDQLSGKAAVASPKLEGYDFVATDGRRFQVVWNEMDGEAVAHTPPGPIIAVTDPMGNAVPFTEGRLTIGAEPRYVFFGQAAASVSTPTPTASSGSTSPATGASGPAGPVASASGNRRFPSGFSIKNDRFWDYFNGRGGVNTFGYPISREFRLQGFQVQFFQGHVLQLRPDGSVTVLNLLQEGLMPVTRINGSTLPPSDAVLTSGAPRVGDAAYADKIVAFMRQHAPNELDGMPVRFFDTFSGTVDLATAFPNGDGNPSLLPLINLEVWGAVLSRPMVDPSNSDFVYQRYQRSIMHYRHSCRCTERLLLAEWFKSVMTGDGLPPDLGAEMASSAFIQQYDNRRPLGLARPDDLPDTDMKDAFERE